MAKITLKGNPIETAGNLPATGTKAPDFSLTTGGLDEVGLKAYAGKRKILNILPSLDTVVCAKSARKLSAEVAKLKDVDGVAKYRGRDERGRRVGACGV